MKIKIGNSASMLLLLLLFFFGCFCLIVCFCCFCFVVVVVVVFATKLCLTFVHLPPISFKLGMMAETAEPTLHGKSKTSPPHFLANF